MSIENPSDSQSLLWMLSFMGKGLKMSVPKEFHARTIAVKQMLQDDVSGIIDSLTDFMVESALVDFKIESDNKELQKTLNKWLYDININYNGIVPKGISALSEEYYKERWKASSFPVLKTVAKESFNKIILPSKLFFVDGGSIYVDKESAKSKQLEYIYYLGKESKDRLNRNTIITKPYGFWHDVYPETFLIKRGVYHNYLLMKELKTKQGKLLEQLVPYILEVLKGESDIARQKGKVYKDPELKSIIGDIKDLIEKSQNNDRKEAPIRVSQDEIIKHLIPEIEKMFNVAITSSIERSILAGLGFVDVAEAITSRKEIQLNPKVFISEIKKGVKDFKSILELLIHKIIRDNLAIHPKYMNATIRVTHSPIRTFMTDKFIAETRLAWKNGILSHRTYIELMGFDPDTEILRRTQEAEDGTEFTLYPHITQNDEEKVSFEETKRQEQLYNEDVDQETDKNGDPIPEDKLDKNQKDQFDGKIGQFLCECIKCGNKAKSDSHCISLKCSVCGGQMRRANRPGIGNPGSPRQSQNLETAPYKTIKELPASVKNNMTDSLQRVFVKVFNDAFERYNSDEKAFRVSWSVIRKISKKDKSGKWVRKTEKTKSGKTVKVKATKEIVQAAYNESENESENQQRKNQIEDIVKLKQLEVLNAQLKHYKGQEKLQDKFLKNKDK